MEIVVKSSIVTLKYLYPQELIAMANLNVAVGEAVQEAQEAYEQADKSPFDHGFAHMEVDGRTSLAHALKRHPDVDAGDTSYITVDGVSRYLTAQRAAYRAFVDTLDEYGVDTDVTISGRLD